MPSIRVNFRFFSPITGHRKMIFPSLSWPVTGNMVGAGKAFESAIYEMAKIARFALPGCSSLVWKKAVGEPDAKISLYM